MESVSPNWSDHCVSPNWSDLHRDALSVIANFLDPEDDLWRLRAVCSAWRSNLSHLPSTSPDFLFPLKLPSMDTVNSKSVSNGRKGEFLLNKSTVYRIYPPGGEGNSWMFKVSKTRGIRGTFSFLVPVSTRKIKSPIGSFLKPLSRLDCRITEICRSYGCEFIDLGKPRAEASQDLYLRRTIVLRNYILDCDFVVMVVNNGGKIYFWRRGDVCWTELVTDKDYEFDDVVLCEGKCFAVDVYGVLVLIGPSLEVTEITSSLKNHPDYRLHSLVGGLNSELYMVYQLLNPTDFPEVEGRIAPLIFRVFKLNMTKMAWDCVNELGDQVLFLCIDTTFSVSVEHFKGFKKNCLYSVDFNDDNDTSVPGMESLGMYDLRGGEAVPLTLGQEHAKFYWPPPSWLMTEAGSSEC